MCMNGFANEIVREDRKGEDRVPDLNGCKVRPRSFPTTGGVFIPSCSKHMAVCSSCALPDTRN